jgi:hypothetical protein
VACLVFSTHLVFYRGYSPPLHIVETVLTTFEMGNRSASVNFDALCCLIMQQVEVNDMLEDDLVYLQKVC